MQKKILLTSFDTWLSEQQSNSADDLLLELAKMACLDHDLNFLRRLPVDVDLASFSVIAKINELQPDYIICCGMAASRKNLSVEVFASIMSLHSTVMASRDCPENSWTTTLQTIVNVEQLIVGTAAVEISYDCGKFVCEGLYYSVLDYLSQSQLSIPCIFVHVPILHQENLRDILADFVLIINQLVRGNREQGTGS
ncbi:peptidase C15 [Anabaena sp. UHCC 0451]|uniref:pyroglutamyl-peptidase I family protein n=1 Tax=Anabaena sp. UHCC 0451 TaxID=2055235 RepID=UPI002B220E4E|nr:peptidase C15 [Anabaena sp. UHCC 0451]MEA5578779.1 peptidase C15 [Anabaena sp. UHCC 0451]